MAAASGAEASAEQQANSGYDLQNASVCLRWRFACAMRRTASLWRAAGTATRPRQQHCSRQAAVACAPRRAATVRRATSPRQRHCSRQAAVRRLVVKSSWCTCCQLLACTAPKPRCTRGPRWEGDCRKQTSTGTLLSAASQASGRARGASTGRRRIVDRVGRVEIMASTSASSSSSASASPLASASASASSPATSAGAWVSMKMAAKQMVVTMVTMVTMVVTMRGIGELRTICTIDRMAGSPAIGWPGNWGSLCTSGLTSYFFAISGLTSSYAHLGRTCECI
eukprot:scaffold14634_cov61-Phaeocystis_antarctica.AAC.9